MTEINMPEGRPSPQTAVQILQANRTPVTITELVDGEDGPLGVTSTPATLVVTPQMLGYTADELEPYGYAP